MGIKDFLQKHSSAQHNYKIAATGGGEPNDCIKSILVFSFPSFIILFGYINPSSLPFSRYYKTAITPANANKEPKSPPTTFNDDAAPVYGLKVDDGRGTAPVPDRPVPERPVPAGPGAVPDAAGDPPVPEGIGNGGTTVAVGVTVAGALDTSTVAVVSVATGAAGLLAEETLKSSGSVTPLSMAQILGSTPSGQQ